MSDFYEYIEDYLDGTLPLEQRESFEKQLKIDSELKNELEIHKTLRNTLSKHLDTHTQLLRSSIKEAEEKYRNKTTGKVVRWSVASAIVAAAITIFILFNPFADKDLYQMPQMQSHIVRGESSESRYETARELYESHSFFEARTILDEILLDDPDNVEFEFYRAMTFFGEEDWMSASKALHPISLGESVLTNEATYYLAICQYELGEVKQALKTLEKIVEGADKYESAQALLKKWQ